MENIQGILEKNTTAGAGVDPLLDNPDVVAAIKSSVLGGVREHGWPAQGVDLQQHLLKSATQQVLASRRSQQGR